MSDVERGQITDASVEMMRRRIGFANPTVRPGIEMLPFNTVATFDSIRHFAEGYGDVNPLFTTPGYGRKTRWGSQIASPGLESTMGYDCTPVCPPELDRETRGALRGVHLFHSGNDARWFRPILPGDELDRQKVVHDVAEKSSEFAGRSVIVTNEQTWWNQHGIVPVQEQHWFVHAERRRSSERTKYAADEPAWYSDEQLAEIERAYDSEYLRGADTLWWEDVEVGDELPTMVKGPLTVTDLISFHIGGGWFGYGNPPLRMAYENRKRLRGFYTRNEFNAWDVIQRIHWEPETARQIGVVSSYDIGPMRWSWLVHYCTNFIGDDAWLARLRGEFRRFNYIGDTTWMTGTVVDKHDSSPLGPSIEIDITATNQRGKANAVGHAWVQLASRERGPVVLPDPPARPMTARPRRVGG